jgi:hypothetical protein
MFIEDALASRGLPSNEAMACVAQNRVGSIFGNSPLRVKQSAAAALLAHPRFRGADIQTLLDSANSTICKTKGVAHVTDRATAIAVLLGAKCVL